MINILKMFRKNNNNTRSLENPNTPLSEYMSSSSSESTIVNSTTAHNFAQFYSCVKIISEAIASLPIYLYQKDGNRKEKAIGHSLYKILHDSPNELMTPFTFIETLIGHLLTWGNAYAYIKRNEFFEPVSLYPIRPDLIEPVISDDQLIYKTKKNDILYSWEVIHVLTGSENGIIGRSPLSVLRNALGLGMALEEFGNKFFSNGLHTGGVLTVPAEMDDKAKAAMKRYIRDYRAGLTNAHTPLILQEPAKYESIGIPPEDAQFLQTRKFQLEELARVFRIPLHMLGNLDRATFSNIEHQSLEFVRDTLRPYLKRFEQELNRKLLTDSNLYFKFNVDSMLRGDIKSRYEAYSIGRQWGWLSTNDIRTQENMNSLPEGDDYLTPLNMKSTVDDQRQSFIPIIQHEVDRIHNKELKAKDRAEKKNNVEQWAETFYPQLKEELATNIEPAIRAMANVTNLKEPQIIINRIVDSYKNGEVDYSIINGN